MAECNEEAAEHNILYFDNKLLGKNLLTTTFGAGLLEKLSNKHEWTLNIEVLYDEISCCEEDKRFEYKQEKIVYNSKYLCKTET